MQPGDTFSDDEHTYTVVEEVGAGGFARAYRVSFLLSPRIPMLQHRIAKVLRDDEDDEHVSRFVREARILANITHPHVVTIHGTCKLPNGQLAIIQEIVDNAQSVRDYLQAFANADEGPGLLLQALYALRAIHERVKPAVFHRDISPSNLLVSPGGHLTVIDFGLAKEDPRRTEGGYTRDHGGRFGTPGCISPDQVRDPSSVDARDDLYSLGRVFGAAIQGRDPEFVNVSAIDDPFWYPLLLQLTAYDREDRPASASVAIEKVLDAMRAASMPLSNPEPHFAEAETVLQPAWIRYVVSRLNSYETIEREDLARFSTLSATVWKDDELQPDRFFAMVDGSEWVNSIGGSSYSAGDPLAVIYEHLYTRLSPDHRLQATKRLASLAMSMNRFRLMDALRSFVSQEQDRGMRAQLRAIVREVDPGGHIWIPDERDPDDLFF